MSSEAPSPEEFKAIREGIRAKLIGTESKQGVKTYQASAYNAETILTNDPQWAGKIELNIMTGDVTYNRRNVSDLIQDFMVVCHPIYGINYTSADIVKNSLMHVARNFQYNPVADYLKSLKWDGRDRLPELMKKLGIEEDNEYYGLYTEYLRKWTVAAVARAVNPGCKADAVLVFIGEEGIGKSTFFKVLAGTSKQGEDWFNDTPVSDDKDSYMLLRSFWIHELGEVDYMMRKSDNSKIKAFLTSCSDTYRSPYARKMETVKRSFIVCASSNRENLLSDFSGEGRRWWVMPIQTDFDALMEWTRANRDQIWAQAKALYDTNPDSSLAPEFRDIRKKSNEAHRKQSSLEEVLLDLLPKLAWMAKNNKTDTKIYPGIRSKDIMSEVINHDFGKQVTSGTASHSLPSLIVTYLKSFGWYSKKRDGFNYWTPGVVPSHLPQNINDGYEPLDDYDDAK